MGTIADPNNVLTFGLLVFAAAQVWVTHRAEVYRRRERAADESERRERFNHELDLAFQTVWAEHFRLEALADEWERGDLVQMSLTGLLRPEDLLPRDWATQASMLGRLGIESGYLGGVAITLAHDVARRVLEFNQSLADLFTSDDDRSTGLKAERVREIVSGTRLAMFEDSIRKGARELSLLLWDAIRHSSRSDVIRSMKFRDDLSSGAGRAAVRALMSRGEPVIADAPPPTADGL